MTFRWRLADRLDYLARAGCALGKRPAKVRHEIEDWSLYPDGFVDLVDSDYGIVVSLKL